MASMRCQNVDWVLLTNSIRPTPFALPDRTVLFVQPNRSSQYVSTRIIRVAIWQHSPCSLPIRSRSTCQTKPTTIQVQTIVTRSSDLSGMQGNERMVISARTKRSCHTFRFSASFTGTGPRPLQSNETIIVHFGRHFHSGRLIARMVNAPLSRLQFHPSELRKKCHGVRT